MKRAMPRSDFAEIVGEDVNFLSLLCLFVRALPQIRQRITNISNHCVARDAWRRPRVLNEQLPL